MEIPDRTTWDVRPGARGPGFGIRDWGFAVRWLLRLGGRFLIGREIAAAGEDFGAFQIRTRDADFYLAPCAILLCVRGAVRKAVLRADLRHNPVIRRVDVFHRRRK